MKSLVRFGPAGRPLPGGRTFLAAVVLALILSAAPPPARGAQAVSPGAEAPAAGGPPRAAIVIDDLGQDLEAARQLLGLGLPLGFAVLPFLPHSEEVAKAAADEGREVLLHLPLEPWASDRMKPGPGALYLSQGEAGWRRGLREALDAVPGSLGVSNHMGSRFTEREEAMEAILRELLARRLFFVDSLTSGRSVGWKVARRLGVRSARRTVFLDNEKSEEAVAARIDRLIEGARKWGKVVGIGHPRPGTIAALRAALPRLRASGVRIVPPSEVVE